jgi:hypothetical protein
MECVCGCGRDVSGKLAQRNFIAASVALELLAWDKNRASPVPGPDGREGLIARGADCYARLLDSLHGEGGGDPDDDSNAWLKESVAMRADRKDMNRWQLVGTGPPNLGEVDVEHLDRLHPERSFTGRAPNAAPSGATAVVDTEDDDLVGKLERLRALRAEGALTDDEFAAAKARLLGDGS